MPTPSIIFRTSGPWGAGKGVNLRPEEVDENFWELVQALAAVAALEPVEISSFSVTGNQMTVHMENGSTFGPFPLPQAVLNFTGDWQDGFSYARYDLFTANQSLWLVLQPHDTDSGSDFNPSAANMVGPFYRLVMPYPNVYDIGFFFPGKPGTGIATGEPNGAIFAFRAVRDFYIPAGAAESLAELRVAPASLLSFPIYKNSTLVGSIDFDPDFSDPELGTITLASTVQFHRRDWLRVLRPNSLDANAKDLTATFAALKGTP